MSDLGNEAVARALVSVALSDGKLEDSERAHLAQVCRQLGVAQERLDAWLAAGAAPGLDDLPVPDDPAQKAAVIRRLIQMMLADGEIEKEELDGCLRVAKRYGIKAAAVRAMVREEVVAAAGAPPGPPPLPAAAPRAAPGGASPPPLPARPPLLPTRPAQLPAAAPPTSPGLPPWALGAGVVLVLLLLPALAMRGCG